MTSEITTQDKLRALWETVNALGGTYHTGDDYGQGWNEAIGRCLDIIEAAGIGDKTSEAADELDAATERAAREAGVQGEAEAA